MKGQALAIDQLSFYVFGQEVCFNIDGFASLEAAERCDGERVRNQSDAESLGFDFDQRQAYAIYCDRTFAGHLAREGSRHAEPEERPRPFVAALVESPKRIDVAADEVASQPIADLERAL